MLIANTGQSLVIMNLRTGEQVQLPPGQRTSLADSKIQYIDDSAVLIALFNTGVLVAYTDAGAAYPGFPTTANPADSKRIPPVDADFAAAVVGAAYGVETLTPERTGSDGIKGAMDYLAGYGKVGVIALAEEDYIVGSDITCAPNATIIGTRPKLSFSGNIPDSSFAANGGGTRIIAENNATVFKWNNVAKESVESNIATHAISGLSMKNLTFIGGARAIDIGAYLAMGCTYSEFDEIYAFEQTADYAINIVNPQHVRIGNLYSKNTRTQGGGGIRIAAAMSSALYVGNCVIDGDIYAYTNSRLGRLVSIEAFGPSGCIFNQLRVSGRLQGNRYGSIAPIDINMAFTSGNRDIFVADNTQFDLLRVDMPVLVETAIAGLSIRTVYFVESRNPDNNTVRLTETLHGNGAFTPNATTSGTAKASCYPAVMTFGRSGNSINNSDMGQIDAENDGGLVHYYRSRTRGVRGYIAEVMASATQTEIVCRDCDDDFDITPNVRMRTDESTLTGLARHRIGSTEFAYSGGSFTLDNTWNGREVRYTGTADITITVPSNLISGFRFSITPTAATGIVTFVAASGVGAAVRSFGDKYRTAGQYATAELRKIANRYYRLTGDLQV